MRRFSFLIAATVLVGTFWGSASQLADNLGLRTWLETKLEASDTHLRIKGSEEDQPQVVRAATSSPRN